MQSSDVIELARQKIDAEILELQERIRSLRSSRNVLAPMHSLPPEVITQIFKWVQLLYRGRIEWSCSEATSLPKWIRVTHVSQQWRNIALNSKSLYATILIHNLKYSRETLKLSGSVPLTLIDSTDYDTKHVWQIPELQEFVLSVVPRLRNIWLMNEKAADFLLPHIEKADLPLEELYSREYQSFNLNLFPTSLRYLRLIWCPFQSYEWLSSLSNLVDLDIATPIRGKKLISVDTFLDILDAMPHLISLGFTSLLKPDLTPIRRTSPIKTKLQYMEVSEAPEILVHLLPWLSFASRFRCIIQPHQTISPVDYLSPLLAQVGRHLESSCTSLRTAKLSWGGRSTFRNIETFLSEGADEEPCFKLVLCEPSLLPVQTVFGYWWTSIASLPLDQVESLTVNAKCQVEDWETSPWHSIQSHRRLVIEEEQASLAFLNYLVSSGDDGKDDHPGGTSPFSSLEELTLHRIKYNRDLKAKVQATLISRMKKHGVKLRKLVFHDSTISDDAIKQLSKIVDVVEKHGEKKPTKKRST